MEPWHYLHNSYKHPTARLWHSDHSLRDTNLMYPIFVTNTPDEKTEIASMPGNFRYGYERVVEEIKPLVNREGNRLRSLMIFGVLERELKDPEGNCMTSSPVIKTLQNLKAEFQDKLLLCVDICLCGYTDHGHCGVLNADGSINLEQSNKQLAQMALLYASHGADVVAPSDMMDGRVHAIKSLLAQHSYKVPVLSYSAKFKSCLYGPFRDAADSAPSFGDRASYQLPIYGRDLAIRAALRDVQEGADFVMVKPGLPYLDIMREIKNLVRVPLAVYQVSGEYMMLHQAAASGAVDLKSAVLETMESFLRAGCTIIITYFTPQLLDWM